MYRAICEKCNLIVSGKEETLTKDPQRSLYLAIKFRCPKCSKDMLVDKELLSRAQPEVK